MWPIVGLTLGGAIFGFAGAFVGVPLISFLNRVLESDLSRRESDPEVTATPLEKLKDTIKN
jgi:predicted PurR-regulated permease PerM